MVLESAMIDMGQEYRPACVAQTLTEFVKYDNFVVNGEKYASD